MKNLYLIILFLFPICLIGQNFEFKIGAAINVTNPYINDLIMVEEPTVEDIIRDNGADYGWAFYYDWLPSYFNRYRITKPRVGATIKGIATIGLTPNLQIRTGGQLQFTSFHRHITRTSVSYRPPDKFDIVLDEFSFETTERILYFTIPINLVYNFNDNKMGAFGGFMLSSRMYDNKVEIGGESQKYFNHGNIGYNPIVNEMFTSLNFGFNYQLTQKLSIEVEAIYGLNNMLAFSNNKKEWINRYTPWEEFPEFVEDGKSFLRQGSIGVSYKLF